MKKGTPHHKTLLPCFPKPLDHGSCHPQVERAASQLYDVFCLFFVFLFGKTKRSPKEVQKQIATLSRYVHVVGKHRVTSKMLCLLIYVETLMCNVGRNDLHRHICKTQAWLTTDRACLEPVSARFKSRSQSLDCPHIKWTNSTKEKASPRIDLPVCLHDFPGRAWL